MDRFKNIDFQIKQYQFLEAKGELTEYAQGKLNGMLEVMNIAKNNEVLDLVSKPFTKKQLDDAMRKAKEYDEDINWE